MKFTDLDKLKQCGTHDLPIDEARNCVGGLTGVEVVTLGIIMTVGSSVGAGLAFLVAKIPERKKSSGAFWGTRAG